METYHSSMFLPNFYSDKDKGFPSRTSNQLLTGLAALWDEPVSYVLQFAQALGSVNEGYFISYFSQKCMPGEWVQLNENIIWKEAGLTPKQWRKIRYNLIKKKLLLNRRMVFPTGSLFTLDDHLLESMIKERANTNLCAITAPPISINKLHLQTFSELGCSIKSVLYLSFVKNETEYQPINERGDWSPWARMPEHYVIESCYLSRREQESAIRKLTDLGVIECRLEGKPATRSIRYSLKRLGELTAEFINRSL